MAHGNLSPAATMIRSLAVVLLVAAVASATEFGTCKSGLSPTRVDVPGCDKLPCRWIRGDDVEADVDIPIDHPITSLTTKVLATSLGVTVEYPLPDSNACNGLTNSQCPLSTGESVTYHLEMPILKIYPKVRVDIEFQFLDQNKKIASCFQFSGVVVDG